MYSVKKKKAIIRPGTVFPAFGLSHLVMMENTLIEPTR